MCPESRAVRGTMLLQQITGPRLVALNSSKEVCFFPPTLYSHIAGCRAAKMDTRMRLQLKVR